MIQRIQTVFLLLSAICGIIALVLNFTSTEAIAMNVFADLEYLKYAYLGLILLGVAISIWSIFKYTNRVRQMRFVDISTLAYILSCISMAVAFFISQNTPQWSCISQYLPILSIILNLIAKNRIKFDENLVRSADRLR